MDIGAKFVLAIQFWKIEWRELHHHQQMWKAVISLKYNLENNSHETWEPNTEQSTERCRNKNWMLTTSAKF
jgi:hypothetical protein